MDDYKKLVRWLRQHGHNSGADGFHSSYCDDAADLIEELMEGKDMKEIKRYVCEICKTEYADKTQAQKCERTHKLPLEIVSQRYRPVTDDQTGYPQTITVKMGDGREVTYKR